MGTYQKYPGWMDSCALDTNTIGTTVFLCCYLLGIWAGKGREEIKQGRQDGQ